MISPFKEKIKNQTSKSRKQMHSFFAKIYLRDLISNYCTLENKLASTSSRIENCIVNIVFKYSNGIVPEYIHEMFKPSLYRYSRRSQMENKFRAKKLILLIILQKLTLVYQKC